MGTRKVELGPVGKAVKHHVRRLREEGQLSLQDLSDRLEFLGRPILPSGISKIESGDRRVDVDDLVALAHALGTAPNELLKVPNDDSETFDESGLTVEQRAASIWAAGQILKEMEAKLGVTATLTASGRVTDAATATDDLSITRDE
jgi:transcriptional regulator with XRE-family HTH domain